MVGLQVKQCVFFSFFLSLSLWVYVVVVWVWTCTCGGQRTISIRSLPPTLLEAGSPSMFASLALPQLPGIIPSPPPISWWKLWASRWGYGAWLCVGSVETQVLMPVQQVLCKPRSLLPSPQTHFLIQQITISLVPGSCVLRTVRDHGKKCYLNTKDLWQQLQRHM